VAAAAAAGAEGRGNGRRRSRSRRGGGGVVKFSDVLHKISRRGQNLKLYWIDLRKRGRKFYLCP
jgi:hypothetical protein